MGRRHLAPLVVTHDKMAKMDPLPEGHLDDFASGGGSNIQDRGCEDLSFKIENVDLDSLLLLRFDLDRVEGRLGWPNKVPVQTEAGSGTSTGARIGRGNPPPRPDEVRCVKYPVSQQRDIALAGIVPGRAPHRANAPAAWFRP